MNYCIFDENGYFTGAIRSMEMGGLPEGYQEILIKELPENLDGKFKLDINENNEYILKPVDE